MSMSMLTTDGPSVISSSSSATTIETYLMGLNSKTYTSYYDGKMSYTLHGESWDEYVRETFQCLSDQTTSENVFKAVIDLYAENLVPEQKELKGFSNTVVPLLMRGQAPVVVSQDGTPHFAEHYEMISDGRFTIAALFTRDLEKMKDYVTFAYSSGTTRIFSKAVPNDLSAAERNMDSYAFEAEEHGSTLFRFALDDKGFGATMSALQDRVNHSIIDQTVVAEMYARPFWYLLNVSIPPNNPYLPADQSSNTDELKERRGTGAAGRIFTSSGEGPFGQLDPPTITDMISYHDSIVDKVSQSSGIPQFYFKPGTGTPPTGVALKVLSKRFNNKIGRMRDDIQDQLEALSELMGLEKNGTEKDPTTGKETPVYEFWSATDDLLQESLDAHGISLSQMGYPLEYIAEVVTPGVNLDDYAGDALGAQVPPATGAPGQPTDMTAMGQPGLPATPGQVQAYAQNPGQRAAGK